MFTATFQRIPMRYVPLFFVVATMVGFAWVFSLPSKAECVASGRVVDPTERHCNSPTGFQQLEEHALFHSRETVLGGGIVLAGIYAFGRYHRRRWATDSPRETRNDG